MVTEVNLVQLQNAKNPIDFTLLGMSMDVILLQLEKAEFPIDITPSGKVTDVRPLHPWKTFSPM